MLSAQQIVAILLSGSDRIHVGISLTFRTSAINQPAHMTRLARIVSCWFSSLALAPGRRGRVCQIAVRLTERHFPLPL